MKAGEMTEKSSPRKRFVIVCFLFSCCLLQSLSFFLFVERENERERERGDKAKFISKRTRSFLSARQRC